MASLMSDVAAMGDFDDDEDSVNNGKAFVSIVPKVLVYVFYIFFVYICYNRFIDASISSRSSQFNRSNGQTDSKFEWIRICQHPNQQ